MSSPVVSLKYLIGMTSLSFAVAHTCDGYYNKKMTLMEIIKDTEARTIDGITRALTLPKYQDPEEEDDDITEEKAETNLESTVGTSLIIDLSEPFDASDMIGVAAEKTKDSGKLVDNDSTTTNETNESSNQSSSDENNSSATSSNESSSSTEIQTETSNASSTPTTSSEASASSASPTSSTSSASDSSAPKPSSVNEPSDESSSDVLPESLEATSPETLQAPSTETLYEEPVVKDLVEPISETESSPASPQTSSLTTIESSADQFFSTPDSLSTDSTAETPASNEASSSDQQENLQPIIYIDSKVDEVLPVLPNETKSTDLFTILSEDRQGFPKSPPKADESSDNSASSTSEESQADKVSLFSLLDESW